MNVEGEEYSCVDFDSLDPKYVDPNCMFFLANPGFDRIIFYVEIWLNDDGEGIKNYKIKPVNFSIPENVKVGG